MNLGTEKFEAGREFTLAGRKYDRGELVDTSELEQHKLRQLLNQRYLRPTQGVVGDNSLKSP